MSSIFTQVPIKTIVKKFRGGATVIGVLDTDKVLLISSDNGPLAYNYFFFR